MYLVRFVVGQDYGEDSLKVLCSEHPNEVSKYQAGSASSSLRRGARSEPGPSLTTFSMTTQFPASVSIAHLLEAGKLVKPPTKNKVLLTFEKYDIVSKEWLDIMEVECVLETEKFASGGFRDAYRCASKKTTTKEWVLKSYNDAATEVMLEKLNTTPENHSRKQVQMHEVARHLTRKFKSKAPAAMGKCFEYNHSYYTMINNKPATVEEFVPGPFVKLINNDGRKAKLPEQADEELKELHAKAECLVHYTYVSTDKKLMLLDIQGSGYSLYDPEIATNDLMDATSNEFYFCCGNCSSLGITTFLNAHECNVYCDMMGLSR